MASYKGFQDHCTHCGDSHTCPSVTHFCFRAQRWAWLKIKSSWVLIHVRTLMPIYLLTILIPWPHPLNKWGKKNFLQFTSITYLCHSCFLQIPNIFLIKNVETECSDNLLSIHNGWAGRLLMSLIWTKMLTLHKTSILRGISVTMDSITKTRQPSDSWDGDDKTC